MDTESFDAVCFGELLWDLLPSGDKPGGAPMNVAFHLRKLGLRPALISRLGSDERGAQLRSVLSAHHLPAGHVSSDTVYPTGIVHATIGAGHEVTYDIVQPAAWDFIPDEKSLQALVANAGCFIFGSLSARHEVSRKTLLSLLEAASYKVLDINLRPPHFSRDLVGQLMRAADLLKLNEHELALISSWHGDFEKEEDQLRLLQDLFAIPTVIVTKGGAGAMVCRGGKIAAHPGYQVKVEDTVGSGDAFLAAFLFQKQGGAGMEETLSFANALGAVVASKSGACPEYDVKEADGLRENALQRQA